MKTFSKPAVIYRPVLRVQMRLKKQNPLKNPIHHLILRHSKTNPDWMSALTQFNAKKRRPA
jgi:hypothetical protein